MLNQTELSELFLPYILDRRRIFENNGRLVHYTNADAAFKIISGRQIWLRNAQMMNDFSEIQHGIDCLQAAWSSDAGKKMQENLDNVKDGLRDELAQLFDGHALGLRQNTFITSLSEHDDKEDNYGRLSMWRAYGGRTGVALILNNTAFAAETSQIQVFSSPVFYHDVAGFVEWFQGWAGNLAAAEASLRDVGAEGLRNLLFMVFRTFALCTKHPAFAEEREWRLFHSPTFEGRSEWVERSIEVIEGVPQHVIKLHLKDKPEAGVNGVAPKTLLNRVLIGPCLSPIQVRAALTEALTEAGVENSHEKMWMSLIPYRH